MSDQGSLLLAYDVMTRVYPCTIPLESSLSINLEIERWNVHLNFRLSYFRHAFYKILFTIVIGVWERDRVCTRRLPDKYLDINILDCKFCIFQ